MLRRDKFFQKNHGKRKTWLHTMIVLGGLFVLATLFVEMRLAPHLSFRVPTRKTPSAELFRRLLLYCVDNSKCTDGGFKFAAACSTVAPMGEVPSICKNICPGDKTLQIVPRFCGNRMTATTRIDLPMAVGEQLLTPTKVSSLVITLEVPAERSNGKICASLQGLARKVGGHVVHFESATPLKSAERMFGNQLDTVAACAFLLHSQDDVEAYVVWSKSTALNAIPLIKHVDIAASTKNNAQTVLNPCSDNDTLLVMAVHTVPDAYLRRQAIRETYGQWASRGTNVRVIFVLAHSTDLGEVVDAEASLFRDIMVIDAPESYDTLLQKTIITFRTLLNLCPKADFFMKLDDDSFVVVDKLTELLSQTRNKPYAYIGHFFPRQEVYHDTNEKNFEPNFDGVYYPPYASGSGYVLSRLLVHYIVEYANRNSPPPRMLRNEDAAIGLWTTGLNIERINDAGFWPEPPGECISSTNKMTMIHRQPVKNFYSYYLNYEVSGDICKPRIIHPAGP